MSLTISGSQYPTLRVEKTSDISADEKNRIRKETLALLQSVHSSEEVREKLVQLAIQNRGLRNVQNIDLNDEIHIMDRDLSFLASNLIAPQMLALPYSLFVDTYVSLLGLKRLSSCKTIKTLIANSVSIDDKEPLEVMKGLGEFAQETQVENLAMRSLNAHSSVDKKGAFLSKLACNPHLRNLSFDYNIVTSLALEALGNSSLTQLSLRRCTKMDGQILDDQDIAALLRHNATLTRLELENLFLSNEGCKSLRQHPALSDVRIYVARGLTNEGVQILLRNNPKLTSLSINYLGDENAYKFSKLDGSFMPFVLKSSLERLDISFTDFTDESLVQLAESRTIIHLHARGTIWAPRVLAAFEKNTSLTYFGAGDIATSPEESDTYISNKSLRNYFSRRSYKEWPVKSLLLRNQRLLHNWRLLVGLMALARSVKREDPLWEIRASAISSTQSTLSSAFRELLAFDGICGSFPFES